MTVTVLRAVIDTRTGKTSASKPALRRVPWRLCATCTRLLPRAFFNGVENQSEAGFLIPKCSIQDEVERIWGVPIGLVKLADVLRPALVFVPYAALSLRAIDSITAHHPLDADR